MGAPAGNVNRGVRLDGKCYVCTIHFATIEVCKSLMNPGPSSLDPQNNHTHQLPQMALLEVGERNDLRCCSVLQSFCYVLRDYCGLRHVLKSLEATTWEEELAVLAPKLAVI